MTGFSFGFATDRPASADYDGDARLDPAVFQAAAGLWAVKEATRAYYGTYLDLPVTR
ncbi:MAG: hypothetical protein V1789_05505 [PVC group bacterium]